MATGGEMKAFVFSIVFILVFAAFTSSIPVDMQGLGEDPDEINPLIPSTIFGWEDYEAWNKSLCSSYGTPVSLGVDYEYSLNTRDWWFMTFLSSAFQIGAKNYWGGWLYLGQLDSVEFVNPTGGNVGHTLYFDQIDDDAVNGTVTYGMFYVANGAKCGDLAMHWDTTTYTNSSDAWDNEELNIMHGFGLAETATLDATSLLIGILLLQLPDCPLLLNVLIASPLYACVVFLIWFIIKETLPFV